MRRVKYGHLPSLINTIFWSFLSNLCSGLLIYNLKFVTDYGINKQMVEMLATIKGMILLVVGLFLANYIELLAKAYYLRKSLILMKETYANQLLKLDITQVLKDQTSIYRSDLTNEFDRYEEKYLINILELINMTLTFTVASFVLALISPVFLVVALILLMVFLFITTKVSKPLQKQEAKKSFSLQAYTNFIEESLLGFVVIKQHQLNDKRAKEFEQLAKQVQHDNYLVDIKSTQVDTINRFLQTLLLFSGLVGGILFARSYGFGLGNIIVVASAFGSIMWPLQELSPVLAQMKGIEGLLTAFEKHLAYSEVKRQNALADFNQLKFASATLGYQADEQVILQDVNLDIEKGEKVLIVGVSGAGKSTILKTIRQSITLLAGEVTVDQKDIFSVIPQDYYRFIATIDQIGFVFNGSLKDNITLFQTFDQNQFDNILKLVGLANLTAETQLLNDGANVSGGQRARIILARALYLHNEVLLCDEIFANLESELAVKLEADLLKLPKTIINVSHIIFKNSLSLYDKIYIVEQGTVRLANSLNEVWERMIITTAN